MVSLMPMTPNPDLNLIQLQFQLCPETILITQELSAQEPINCHMTFSMPHT